MSNPFLSLVIPAYNEERRIGQTLEAVVAYLTGRYPYEIVVADDGSRDGTVAVVRKIAQRHRTLQLIQQGSNRGKGAAVRTGMMHATGAMVCFTDADLSTPITTLERALLLLQGGSDVVIASRALPESELAIRQNLVRETMGKSFNLMVRTLFGVRFRDTQCGFKAFHREAAQAIFSRARIDGFAFDVEILLLAERLGYRIAELPVRWENSRPSKVQVPVHPFRMWGELWAIRRHLRRGFYQLPQPTQRTVSVDAARPMVSK